MSSVKWTRVYLRPPTLPEWRCDSNDHIPVRRSLSKGSGWLQELGNTIRGKVRPGHVELQQGEATEKPENVKTFGFRFFPQFLLYMGGCGSLLPPLARHHDLNPLVNQS